MQQSPGEVVENDYVAAAQGRDQLGFDVAVEEFAVDPSPWSLGPVAFPWLDVDDPGRVEAVVAQGSDEGPGVPVAEGGMTDQPFADRGPAGGLYQVGLQRCLIDEHQPFQHVAHEGLAVRPPDVARLGHLRPQGFTGEQRFFYG